MRSIHNDMNPCKIFNKKSLKVQNHFVLYRICICVVFVFIFTFAFIMLILLLFVLLYSYIYLFIFFFCATRRIMTKAKCLDYLIEI